MKKSIILKAILLAQYSDFVYSSGFVKKNYIHRGCLSRAIVCCAKMKQKVKLFYYFINEKFKILRKLMLSIMISISVNFFILFDTILM